jgi:hypothetical protein
VDREIAVNSKIGQAKNCIACYEKLEAAEGKAYRRKSHLKNIARRNATATAGGFNLLTMSELVMQGVIHLTTHLFLTHESGRGPSEDVVSWSSLPVESLVLRGGGGVGQWLIHWVCAGVRGAGIITFGRRKVKKIEVGSVLRSRDGVPF